MAWKHTELVAESCYYLLCVNTVCRDMFKMCVCVYVCACLLLISMWSRRDYKSILHTAPFFFFLYVFYLSLANHFNYKSQLSRITAPASFMCYYLIFCLVHVIVVFFVNRAQKPHCSCSPIPVNISYSKSTVMCESRWWICLTEPCFFTCVHLPFFLLLESDCRGG